VENKQARKQLGTQSMAGLATCFMPVSCLAYSSTLKMKAVRFSETSVNCQRISWLYIPKDRNLQRNLLVSIDNKSTSKEQQNAGLSGDVLTSASMASQIRFLCQSFAERDKAEIYSDCNSQIQYREIV
jgi:hypothetical protein